MLSRVSFIRSRLVSLANTTAPFGVVANSYAKFTPMIAALPRHEVRYMSAATSSNAASASASARAAAPATPTTTADSTGKKSSKKSASTNAGSKKVSGNAKARASERRSAVRARTNARAEAAKAKRDAAKERARLRKAASDVKKAEKVAIAKRKKEATKVRNAEKKALESTRRAKKRALQTARMERINKISEARFERAKKYRERHPILASRAKSAPRAPANAYSLFVKERFKSVRESKTTPGTKLQLGNVTRAIATEWKNLPESDKARLLQQAKSARDSYERAKQEYEKELPPKRPPTSFMSYVIANHGRVARANPSLKLGGIGKQLGVEFKALPQAERDALTSKANAEMDAWRKKIDEWKALHPKAAQEEDQKLSKLTLKKVTDQVKDKQKAKSNKK